MHCAGCSLSQADHAAAAAAVLCVQVMPQLLSLMELDAEDPHVPDW
jgi:hypothetical protein